MDLFEEINCKHLDKRLAAKTKSVLNGKIELQKQAFDAWTNFFKNEDQTQSKINGQLSCFCNN